MDMIKVVGSTAIALIVTLLVGSFTLLYNQINNVRQEMKTEMKAEIKEVRQEIKEVRQEMNAKFDKLYDLIANKK